MHKPRTPERVLLAADSGAVLSTVQIRGCSVVGMRTNEARTVVACLGSNLQNMKLMITSAQARVIIYRAYGAETAMRRIEQANRSGRELAPATKKTSMKFTSGTFWRM